MTIRIPPLHRLLAVLLLLSLGYTLSPTPAHAAPNTPKIAWSPCYRDTGFPFECGTVQVPLDYSSTGVAAISISVVRLPATDSAQRIGSLFLNPGGPGGSGVDYALGAGPILYTPEVRAHFDMVGFDPRGIARSTALRCFGNPKQWTPYFTQFAFPLTPEEEAVWQAADLYLDAACEQRGFKIIDHMTTADAARDLDMLRQAVGDGGLTYAGVSYGTYLGVTYVNLFPDKVRAVVVDGVLDPIAWSTGEPGEAATIPFATRLHSDQGSLLTLNQFFFLCDAYADNCPFSGNAADRFAKLAARLRAEPFVTTLPDGTTFTFTYQDLISNALGAMYSSFSWPSFAQFLAAIDSLVSPTVAGASLEFFWEDAGFITKRGPCQIPSRCDPQYYNAIEGFPGVACSDSDNPNNYPAWAAAATEAEAQYGYFGPIWTWISSICAAWPGLKIDRYIGPFTHSTANSVLVIGNFYDPATRYQGAQKVAGLLPDSRLLSVNGWGHTSLFLSHCVDQAISNYLISGNLPAEGTVCNQDLVPFRDFSLSAGPTSLGAAAGRAVVIPTLVPDTVKRGIHGHN